MKNDEKNVMEDAGTKSSENNPEITEGESLTDTKPDNEESAGNVDGSMESSTKDAETAENKKNDDICGSEGANETKDDGPSGKKGRKKKDPRDEKISELTDKYQRLFAEFQNFRSRSEKEKNSRYDMGASMVIEKILPCVDNVERGIASLSEDDLKTPVGEGMALIYKQFTSVLKELGVEPIEAVGCEFDPELHNAVMHEENDEFGENIVSAELQKGYTYKGNVLRHSMVKVAN